MNNHISRIGNITSSGIAAIMSNDKSGKPGKPFFTYIEECNMERRLGRGLETDNNSKACAWGNLCEIYVMGKNEYIGLEYSQRPDEPIVSEEFDFHSGTPDMTKVDTVCDLKSPFTLKSFCQMVEPLYKGLQGIEAIEYLRENYVVGSAKTGEKYYWQLVSNAILTKSKYAELFIFCPYQDELNEIRATAQMQDGAAGKYYGIANSNDEDLPFLIKGGYYKNINMIRFEVPQADKDLLNERLALCEGYLEKVKQAA